jgi:enoyl-CoA hydratase/carnithine racemase
MTTGTDEVGYEVEDRVATITLDRPDRLNAITPAMLQGLTRAFEAADGDRGVRACILTGAGRGFCAGLDLKEAAAGTGISREGVGASAPKIRDLPTTVLFEMDTPVIAAINGPAAGYGLDLALGCDLRLIAASAKLVPGTAKRGVVPESGGTWYLPRLLGWAKAAELCFLARDVDAPEAVDLGLANLLVDGGDLLDTARSWAEEIAANAPLAIQATKRLFRHGMTEDFHSHTHHALLQVMQLFGTQDFAEGVSAFAEGRTPRFEGR